LANLLSQNFDQVSLWARHEVLVETLNTQHENPEYLAGIALSPKIHATTSLEECVRDAELVVSAIPSHATRDVMRRALPALPTQVPIVTVAKGIENDTLFTMTEVLQSCLPEGFHPYLAVLSGPSFARELAQRIPTAVTVAAASETVALRCQEAFQTDTFRAYTSTDLVGVQLGGALKNVIALAAGIVDGLALGDNVRAALITRGLAEIARMAVRRGANPLTLSGLSGLGDLVLTCTGALSRNRRVGIELGQGKTLEQIMAGMSQVAEGVRTAKSAQDLALKTGIEMPICQQVYRILYEGKSARGAVTELMTRQPKAEL
jgi:glycerol-3-phosphate dehydrogenase (NAD(P)+)